MSFEAHITKMDERPVPKLWLAKPDFTIIERINGVSNLSAKMNYMNENEISFDVNSHLFDEFTNEQYRNPTIEKIRNKYLIKMTYNKQTEWFIIENFSKTSDDKDYVPTTAKYIGSELDKKWVGDIEEIGVTPAQLFNKFLPVIAPNWSVRSIDEKVANIKREYTTSDASVSTLIEEVCKATDAVVVFHNRDRQFSLVHRDNAGKFKGLKVKEATYLKGFTDEQNSENLTTRLVLFGKDGLTINSVNPAGTDYIEDFSYYMRPFRRDSRRNVLEHSDYMSDALCHALLDFEEYFSNKTDEYEDLSEQYTNLLKEQLEEEFKLTEIAAIKQRLEDRVELLKPQGNYTEKRILGNTSFDFKHNTRYIMVIQNNGTTARLTLNGEEQIIAGGQSGYFKIHTPPQVTNEDPQIKHTLQVLSASPNLMASLSTASEADFAEEDILEIEKKFNVYKYRELYTYQVGILAAVERRIKEYDNRRQSINDSLAVDTFFPPALIKERENFINWGVWREEDHTDAKELLEDGLKQLKEHNNVERTVTVSLIDFIQSLEDKENWDKLSAGDKIQFSNKIYDANMEAFISELNINFDNHDISVTLSNIIDLKDKHRGIAQKMASFVSTAGQVNMQKNQLEDQLHKSNQVIALLEGEWDANKRRITAANETVSIDNRGIIVTSPSHPNEMLVAVAGVIAISNDGGETFKQAINTRGVVAERLIGKVLIGTELVMENNAGTFRFDNDGVRINASNFHLIADDGEDYFDTLLRRLQQEVVTAEEKISEEIKQQGESLKSEINDVDKSLMDYTAGLIQALADGMLTEQEIHSLKLQLNMLEADYSQVERRVKPILYDSALDPSIQEELYTVYHRLDYDYQLLVEFIHSLEEPTKVPQETIENIIELLKNFKPAIEELVIMIETSLANTQKNRIANAEYNSNTFAENLAIDLNDEINDLNESLKGLNDNLEDALSDGIITTVEKSQLSDALMRFESEKQDVDNRFHNTYNHAHIIGTTNRTSLQKAKNDYNNAYNSLIAKVKQILNMSSVSHAIVEEYKALYQEFTTAVVAYSEEYERAVEFIQKGYADTAEGEAKKYTDGLRMEVEADVQDIHDNIVEFETDVYGAFKDGIITEQERNRLGIHHDMLEKEKSDLIERYDTIITSDYLQGFYDVEQLVTARSLYGQVHADLLLALELAMMDSKITKEESQEATRLFALYVQRLTQFSKELELAIAALGESKAVAHTNEQLNNYMSLSVFNDEIAMLQAEIDGHVMTWYYDHEPTLSTLPASEWKDDKTRNAHVGDLFYHESEGFAFRFMRKSGGGYEWQLIKDTEVTKALSDAQNALDLADDKRRVFVAQPTPPYDIGDLWIKGDGELMRARVNKEGKTQFSDLDWVKATKYTDDTVANQVGNQLSEYKTSNNREIQDLRETLGAFKQTVEGAFKDGIIAEYELKILKTQMQSLDREKADVDAGYNQLLNHPNLTGAPKTKLQSAYTGFAETHNNLTTAINRVITDGIITEPEYEEVMGLLDSYPIVLTTYKNVMNETYLHLIKMAQDAADGALDIAGRLDTWKSSSFEVDVDKIATRVGESSWEEKWQPVVEQGINDAVGGIEVGGRNLAFKTAEPQELTTSSVRLRYDLNNETLRNNIGKNITFSFEAKFDSNKSFSAYIIKMPSDYVVKSTPISGGTENWKKFSFTGVIRTEAEITTNAQFTLATTNYAAIRNLKVELGNKATDWTEAPEDTEARIAQTNKELKDVKDSLSTFESTITTSFKDGIVETAEAKAINSHKAQLSKEKKDIDQKYTTIHGNSRLTGTAKTNLASAKTAFNNSHNSLMSAINTAIADGKATTAEYNTVISGFGDYEAKLATLTYRFEEANDYIGSAKATSAETNAKTHADTAAKNAKDAAEAYAKTKAEAERVLAEAHADGKVTAEENARIADVNARLKEAKTHADTTSKAAEDAAKEYADIEISKIEVGNRNLIPDSHFYSGAFNAWSNIYGTHVVEDHIWKKTYTSETSAARFERPFTNLEVGQTYTLTMYMKTDADISWRGFLASELIKSSDTTASEEYKIYSVTFKVTAEQGVLIRGYQSSVKVGSYVHMDWFTLVKGNVPTTDWTPAPEDIENQFKTINSNAYGLNEELTKVFKDGIISEAEATAIGDSINLVKSDYENVMKRYTNVYANAGLTGTAKTNLLSARNAYNTSYNALVNHITAVISSGKITNAQRATYNTLFSDYRVKIGVLSDAIESAWDAIVNKKSNDAINAAKKHADDLKKEIDGELADVVAALGSFEGDVTGFIKDGIIEEAEAKAIKVHLQQIDKEKADVDKVYTELYGNILLLGTAKTNLLDAKTAYNTAHSNLKSYITTAISNDKITSTEATNIESRFSTYSTALATLSQRIEQSSNSIAERHAANAADAVSIGGVNLANWTDTTEKNKDNMALVGRANEISLVTLQGESFFQVRVIEASDSTSSIGTYVGRKSATAGSNSYFDIEKGQEYTLTLRGDHSSTVNPFSYVFIMRDDNLENPDSTTSGSNQGVSSALVDRVNVETGYGNRYKFTFTAGWSSRKAYLLIGTHKKAGYSSSTSYWVRFKEAQLEKGNKATDYKLSQKDQDEKLSGAIDDFYNTEIKAKYSTTTQTKELLGSYVTDTEMKGNLDKIATGYAEYDVSQTEWQSLKEANGSSFNDGFSYEVTVRRKTSDDTLFVGIFNSRGKGKGWDREILEQKGSTASHPEVYNTTTGDIRLRTYGSGSTKYAMEVVYTKYAGSFTNLSKTSSMIEQKADEINSEVKKKVGNDEIISRINQSAEKISIDANKINISGQSINIGANPAITGLNTSVGTAQSTANTAKTQADAARVGNNIVNALNNAKTTVNISGDRINIDATQIQLGAGATRSVNAELKNARDGGNIADSINNAPSSVSINADRINLTASSSIRLAINKAEKAGTDAQSTVDNLDLSGTNLISGTNFSIKANVDRLDSPTGGASYTSESEYLLVLNSNNAENSTFGLRTFKDDFTLKQNAEYTLSFEAYSNANTDDNFTYVYLYRYGGSNQGRFTMNKELIGTAGGSTGVEYDLYRYTTTFKNTTGTTPANMLIATRGTGYVWFRIKNVMLTRGKIAVPYSVQGHKVVDTDSLIPSINGDTNGWTITGSKINLVGDVSMVSGNVKVRQLSATSGANTLTMNGNTLTMDGNTGTLTMGNSGIVYRNSGGSIRYEMNENFVRSSTFGTTTANIYMAASNGYEVRFVDIRDVPGAGNVNDYRYIDARMARLYTSGIANNTRYQTDLRLGADGVVAIMNNGLTTYGTLRAAGLESEYLDLRPSSGQTNLYVRPEANAEVRITARGTTATYADLRARSLMANNLFSNTTTSLYLRTDNEVQFTSHGSTSTYRDVRGMFAKFDALDVNTGTHIYARPYGASSELRVTARGTTDQYRDLRFRNWTSVSSEKYKTDITEWDYNVLDIIKNELKIYQYKYKDDVTEGDNVMYQRGLVLERETPSEFIKGDGINQYEVTSWNLKAVQELANENDELKAKNKELEERLEKLEQILLK